MATLYYANQRMDAIRTAEYTSRPVMDPTGMDRECNEVTLAVEGVWSEYGLGSGKVQDLGQTYGVKGDRLGVSLYNLRDVLSAPRQTLQYYLGNTLVLEAPQRDSNNNRFACDVKGGPFPEVLAVRGNVGDKSAMVTFRVKTYVLNCENDLLSNRWSITDHVDENGFVTLTIQGRASFRKDFLSAQGRQADDWRKWIVYPCEPRMRRVSVDVQVSADGSEVNYTVVDRETNYGTGEGSLIANVDCHVTSGSDFNIKNVQDAASEMLQGLGELGSLNFTGFASRLIKNGFATSFVSGVARVTGQPGVDRHYLARVAQSLVFDRVRYDGVNAVPTSTRLSVDWSSDSPPWVEFRGDFWVRVAKVLRTFGRNTAEFDLQNWSPRLAGGGGDQMVPLGWDQDTPRLKLPGGDNTRAENVGRLVAQALSDTACARVLKAPLPGEGDRTRYGLNVSDID